MRRLSEQQHFLLEAAAVFVKQLDHPPNVLVSLASSQAIKKSWLLRHQLPLAELGEQYVDLWRRETFDPAGTGIDQTQVLADANWIVVSPVDDVA